MKITVVGTGYVGLIAGTCLADFGHDVVCVDNDAKKVRRLRQGNIVIYEPGLSDLFSLNVRERRLHFTASLRTILSLVTFPAPLPVRPRSLESRWPLLRASETALPASLSVHRSSF